MPKRHFIKGDTGLIKWITAICYRSNHGKSRWVDTKTRGLTPHGGSVKLLQGMTHELSPEKE